MFDLFQGIDSLFTGIPSIQLPSIGDVFSGIGDTFNQGFASISETFNNISEKAATFLDPVNISKTVREVSNQWSGAVGDSTKNIGGSIASVANDLYTSTIGNLSKDVREDVKEVSKNPLIAGSVLGLSGAGLALALAGLVAAITIARKI